MFQIATLVIFPGAMIFAALSDLFTMTISNRLSVALVMTFVPFAYLAGLTLPDIGQHVACGLLVLTVTFSFFALGWIGGGDAKLAAATAVWLGWGSVADYVLLSAIAGGALTLAILFGRRFPLPAPCLKLSWLATLHDSATGIPYGIALAVAGLLVYPHTSLWFAAAQA